jgi:flagellar hook protein FlgE
MNPAGSARMAADLQNLEAAWSAARAMLLRYDTNAQPDDPALVPSSDGALANSRSLPALQIDGQGFFALSAGDDRVFTRAVHARLAPDGTLVDETGRKVLGFSEREATEQLPASARPHELRLQADSPPSGATGRLEIDPHGTIRMVSKATDARGNTNVRSSTVGRLCLAVFPAPQKLVAGTNGIMRQSSAAGAANYFSAGSPNVGTIRQAPRSAPIADLSEQLARIWSLSGRAEVDVAMATASDALNRTALNLVK